MARLPKVFVAYQWRLPKFVLALLVLEFPLTVACLTLFGIADGDTYRTVLWQNGYDKGFNSAPNGVLYDYANYRPAHIPVVWSSYLTQFNIVISVLSMFLLLVKSTMFVLHAFVPLLSVFIHILLVALYAVSIRDQSAPDMSDPDHPSPGLPWYLSKGCSYAEPKNKGFCMQARASFAVTCVMIALFSIYLILSAWSAIPSKKEKEEREAGKESDVEMKKYNSQFNAEYGNSPDSELSQEEKWERNRQIFLNLPKTPNTPGFGAQNPMTPRTVAFTALNGGEGPSRAMAPSGGLPFRQYFGEGQGKVPDAR